MQVRLISFHSFSWVKQKKNANHVSTMWHLYKAKTCNIILHCTHLLGLADCPNQEPCCPQPKKGTCKVCTHALSIRKGSIRKQWIQVGLGSPPWHCPHHRCHYHCPHCCCLHRQLPWLNHCQNQVRDQPLTHPNPWNPRPLVLSYGAIFSCIVGCFPFECDLFAYKTSL